MGAHQDEIELPRERKALADFCDSICQLPHRTGTGHETLPQDDILRITRATLVDLGRTSISIVLESLASLLEDLARPYGHASTHPSHVLHSESYVLALAADCCSSHWPAGADSSTKTAADPRIALPETLEPSLVKRFLGILRVLLDPISEDYVLPAQKLLEPASSGNTIPRRPHHLPGNGVDPNEHDENHQVTRQSEFDASAKTLVEFISASAWPVTFDYLKTVIYHIRTTATPSTTADSAAPPQEPERSSLAIIRILSCFWVDAGKLGRVIQELCSSFLHFSRPYQNAVAAVMPLLIMRWINRYPQEFVQLHIQDRRLDGGAETLFDMTQTLAEAGRRRSNLYPLQTALLLLLPEVFAVASNLREGKGNSIVKKVSFLDGLRNTLQSGNEQAGYCLVALIRTARHFDTESDSSLVSYAMDVQDEVRDAVFRGSNSPQDLPPFEQDMMTAAFISLAQLNLEEIDNLVDGAVSSTAPHSFKIAMVQACCEFARRPDATKFRDLFDRVLPFMRQQLEFESSRPTSLQKRAEDNSTDLVLSVLQFLEASPSFLLNSPVLISQRLDFFDPFLDCVLSPDNSIRRCATDVAKKLFSESADLLSNADARSKFKERKLRTRLWSRSSKVLLHLCEGMTNQAGGFQIEGLCEYLTARLLLLQNIPELSDIPNDASDVVTAASRLETLLLVSLCSPDVETCQSVTSCIGLFLEECSIVDKHAESAKSSASVLRNGETFRELASRSFHFTGLVAFQKRVRSLLRRMQFPTTGILNAWEIAFDRWIALVRDVSLTATDAVDDLKLSEWRNYSGFLASLGGVCTADQAIILEEPALGGLRWIDRVSSEHYEEALLTRYLKLSIQLLASPNIRVREATRDVLSSEVSTVLYQPLFRSLESELEVLFTGALASTDKDKGQDSEVVFAEQAASLLRGLLERLESPSDLGAASSIHLGSLTLNFAKFLDGITETTNTLRVKIRVCQLCEIITKRKEHLNLRDDVRIRNQLLEYIFGWIARPGSPQQEQNGTGSRGEDLSRVQRDLDRACLKSLADLTFRLPLQPSDSQTDAGMSEMKSQMFHTYFNRFLSLLNHEPSDIARADPSASIASREEVSSNSDLAITILSNLLSANIDVGLKHSLNIGYHDNVEIRTAFVKVLCNILMQGTEFSNLTDSAVSEKYEELLELMTKDLSLPVSMSMICPSSEVDELTICLLTIFEQRGLMFELLEALIKQEVEDTENEAELLRRTCVATKILSVYAKWKGNSYLRTTLQKVLERLLLTSEDLDLELDPARVSSSEELEKNAMQLQIVAKVFIDDICTSSSSIPVPFRKICNIILEAVEPRFPDAKYTAVGAFVFLRFFCPAIVAPEAEGLLSAAPTKEMRRGLLLIAKIIQNLANNVLFGAKEPYMYPLNEFLAQNIWRITTFLREISVPPDTLSIQGDPDTFDFGSCVALHRFLYDHWDHVRQTLVSRERKEYVRSPGELSRGRSPVLEPLRNLIANLGPPPLAVSWNRPQISANSPPLYSRFQNFMLRNAFRSTESFLTARAVFEGGESKDGVSFICIVLRNVDTEGVDYDTLIYCYLKIASRLWHQPFGLLIDATCYNGRSEPQDDIFRTLELLTPSELSNNLTRIHIYNMNSAFKRCFRRFLRSCTKNEDSVFHPNNVEYYLSGSLQELGVYFHLGSLQLPKETLSVVTDTRYMFHPITRLSKSKGKIEVAIKIGSQFVQITTSKRQEIFAGFRPSTTINDIFRLSDIDETAPSMNAEDDSAFGFRADGGKVVMYFTSSKKSEVLQTIRGTKAKHGRDGRSHKAPERLIRPHDVPGTLLNLALTNLSSHDQILRLSSYNLLGALCKAFKFNSGQRLVYTKDLAVPAESAHFIVTASKELAQSEPQLTWDFLTEFFVGWESSPDEQKPLSLAYMAPWLTGLRTYVLPAEAESEKGRDKVCTILRKLIELAVLDHGLSFTLEQVVWPAIVEDEVLLDFFIDELIKTAMTYGNSDETLDILSTVVVGIGTVTCRGKMFARLRKVLNRSSLRPTRYLPDNAVWAEICVLLHFCLALSFDNATQSQLFLPEVFHVVTMLANTGSQAVRQLVYKLLINSIHAACSSFELDEINSSKLRTSLDLLCEPRGDLFSSPLSFTRDGASISTAQEAGSSLSATESLAAILFDICSIAAPSVNMANVWRSRWMGLVASTAFQNNPAIQPRAFTVMGYLAKEEVDDDLLYQVLVSLRQSVSRFGEDGGDEMLVSIITSISRMMDKLPSASRYGLQLFWLAMSLIRVVPSSLFNSTAHFLEAVLANISVGGECRGENMAAHLLQGRAQLDEASLPLDEACGVHFDQKTFHYAVCASIARGLTDTTTRPSAMRVLSSFLQMTAWTVPSEPDDECQDLRGAPYLGLLMARAASAEELKDIMWQAGIEADNADGASRSDIWRHIGDITDEEVLLISAIELVDFNYLEDVMQARSLQWINELAITRPAVATILCGALQPILDDVLLHGQSSITLEAAHILLRTLTSDNKFSFAMTSDRGLMKKLESLGFGGLWRSCSLGSMDDTNRACFELTERLIELIII